MPLLSKEIAISTLETYFQTIYRCIHGAWEDYQGYPEATKVTHDQTTRANIVSGHMRERASKQFVDDVRVKISKRSKGDPSRALFVIDDQISIRFKKLDNDLCPKNIQTGMVRQLNGQVDLPEIPSAYHLVAGYTLNSLQTQIDGVYLVCPNNKKLYWHIEIDESAIKPSHVDLLSALDTEEYGSSFERKTNTGTTEQQKNGTKNKP
jgi:hypothetical protein